MHANALCDTSLTHTITQEYKARTACRCGHSKACERAGCLQVYPNRKGRIDVLTRMRMYIHKNSCTAMFVW